MERKISAAIEVKRLSTVRTLSANPTLTPKHVASRIEGAPGGNARSTTALAGDRIERVPPDGGPTHVPYLSLGADLGFVVGIQANLTIAGGKLYGSVGEYSGLVPGVGLSLETGTVRPNRGQTVASTVEGTSFTGAVGFGVGAQSSVSSAGTLVGVGLTTPSAGVGVTQTKRLFPW